MICSSPRISAKKSDTTQAFGKARNHPSPSQPTLVESMIRFHGDSFFPERCRELLAVGLCKALIIIKEAFVLLSAMLPAIHDTVADVKSIRGGNLMGETIACNTVQNSQHCTKLTTLSERL